MTINPSTVSYASDIRPLFRQKDINAMRRVFDLSRYEDVRENARSIYERLADGTMPCDGPWPKDDVMLFEQWMTDGLQP